MRDALADAGIEPDSVYVTNAVKHFRFEERGKRRLHKKPGIAHIEACNPWLSAEIAAVGPEVLVCLGATAARAVLGREVRIGEERGRVIDVSSAGDGPQDNETRTGPRVVVTAHPSSVLRLRGTEGWREALDALVEDLRSAARVAAHGTGG